MKVEEKFNIEGIADDIFGEMKEDGENFGLFDHYWRRIRMNLLSRGFEKSEVTVLEGLVMEKVEGMFHEED